MDTSKFAALALASLMLAACEPNTLEPIGTLENPTAETEPAPAAGTDPAEAARATGAPHQDSQPRVVTMQTDLEMDEVVERLAEAAERFEDFDLERVANEDDFESGDVELPDMIVFELEDDKGTPEMAKISPTFALELPAKILVWEQAGQTHLAFHDFRQAAAGHGPVDTHPRIGLIDETIRSIARTAVGEQAVLGDRDERLGDD